MTTRQNLVGTAQRRVDGRAKVTGAARYAAEFAAADLLHGAVVSSAIARTASTWGSIISCTAMKCGPTTFQWTCLRVRCRSLWACSRVWRISMTLRTLALAAALPLAALGASHAEPSHDARQAAPVDTKAAAATAPSSFAQKPAPGTRAHCAVSNEEFTVGERTVTSTYNGKVYVFCCADCKPDFDKNPAKYAK